MAAALSDQAWAEFCAIAAAAKLTPDAEARAELSKTLFEEFTEFAYDRERRERTAAAYKRAERMLMHLDAFAELYREAWLPDLPVDQFQAVIAGRASALVDVKTESHLWCVKMLRWRAQAAWDIARAIRHAHAGRGSVQREMLYTRLCTIWLYRFGAPKLSYGQSRGKKPYGPLIRFLLTAMRQVMPEDELPDAETVADAIDRERADRAPVELRLASARRKRMGA